MTLTSEQKLHLVEVAAQKFIEELKTLNRAEATTIYDRFRENCDREHQEGNVANERLWDELAYAAETYRDRIATRD